MRRLIIMKYMMESSSGGSIKFKQLSSKCVALHEDYMILPFLTLQQRSQLCATALTPPWFPFSTSEIQNFESVAVHSTLVGCLTFFSKVGYFMCYCVSWIH